MKTDHFRWFLYQWTETRQTAQLAHETDHYRWSFIWRRKDDVAKYGYPSTETGCTGEGWFSRYGLSSIIAKDVNTTKRDLIVWNFLIHQENLSAKSLKMTNVGTVVSKLNFIRSKGTNLKFKDFFELYCVRILRRSPFYGSSLTGSWPIVYMSLWLEVGNWVISGGVRWAFPSVLWSQLDEWFFVSHWHHSTNECTEHKHNRSEPSC